MKLSSTAAVLLLALVALPVGEQIEGSTTFFNTSGASASSGGKQPIVESTERIVSVADNSQALYSIRCWQNGQMILEESGWSAPQFTAEFVAMRKVGMPLPGIFLVDFQESFCELKQQSEVITNVSGGK